MRGSVAESSGSTPSPRQAALSILLQLGDGRKLDEAFGEVAPALEPRDRRWVQELTYGVTRYRGRLDHLLGLHVKGGLDRLEPRVLNLLRMGAYQMFHMGSVPVYAAVSETVSHVRAGSGKGAAGLANAVLRRLGEAGGGLDRFRTLEEDPVAHLSRWGSHPEWLVARWVSRYGADQAARIVEAGNRIPSIWLQQLEAGREPSRLEPGEDPAAALEGVHAIIQDPAAARVVDWIGAGPGQTVADLCAAPGGKSMGLRATGAHVVSLDRSADRLGRLLDTRQRLGLRIPVVVADAESPPLRPVDVVLVDAPCSGTGTLSRHPDLRWRLSPGRIEALAALQGRILDGAAGAVRPGGLLVYSTCTLEPEENHHVVDAFLARHSEFRLEPDGILELLPGDADGAFAARLRRDGGASFQGA